MLYRTYSLSCTRRIDNLEIGMGDRDVHDGSGWIDLAQNARSLASAYIQNTTALCLKYVGSRFIALGTHLTIGQEKLFDL